MITVNDRSYLLDCGSPIFPSLGYKGIAEINGIFATHSHEDHKRWFTDIVLFTFYNPLFKHKVKLISAEPVLEEFAKNSKAALERSLSPDSRRVIDIPYEDMVEEVTIGPRSKYFIDLVGSGNGGFRYMIKDRQGRTVGPEKAKIFINRAANRPRLLYKDDESGEWVEPSSYYPFSSPVFYEDNQNIYHDESCGLTVKAIKASVWHGVPTVAFKFMTGKNSLLFSADTVYKPSLWKELYETRRAQKFEKICREEFEKGSVIFGDINDFIERTWSRERFEAAMSAYKGAVIIHDVARKNSIVHTDYPDIKDAPIDDLFFTHNPDNITALRPILTSGKRLLLRDGSVFESVKGNLYPFDADVYIHHFSCDLVGYKSESGRFKVIEDDGLLGTVAADDARDGLMRVELYQDIGGEYYPILTEPDKYYCLRQDGKVEEVTIYADASQGRVVENNIRRKVNPRHP